MTTAPAPSLKKFAIGVYSLPGVSPACLQLQSDGQDVCLLLCAAWLLQRSVACTDERVQQLKAASAPWQTSVVTPLRALRQGWKDAAAEDSELAALREKLKGLELDAEMTLLKRLEGIGLEWPANEAPSDLDWLAEIAGDAGTKNPAELSLLRGASATWVA